ncbi:MAG TPA: cytochrome c [Leptospiraceae bacterium]|nr:cytochrome c [Leptospiraceae bacterium]HMW06368.1 cytochrome c [Leptospiraceae bacterium]HMX31720.1 cytochrome c [Leptospiraceae bacterium]HMY32006.1 cytochrome c [Leptospiraceae bacterium]HMZ65781.1 cytochrome c [Leptospiraceae bacterium]
MKFMIRIITVLVLLGLPFTFCKKEGETADSNPSSQSDDNKGIGPIKKVDLGDIDSAKATKGKQHFETKCSACHKFEEKVVGPPLSGITKRRTPEWIMNMILNPVEMTQKDPTAMELYSTYLVQMTFQNVTEDETREILEYFRQMDNKK